MKVLLWLLLLVLVIFAIRKKSQSIASRPPAEPVAPAPAAAEPAAAVESMLCCEHCQIYFPASEAVLRGTRVFCCAAHADLA